jgi:hypothetical protein
MLLIPQLRSRFVAESLRLTTDDRQLTAFTSMRNSGAVLKSQIASALGALMFSQ